MVTERYRQLKALRFLKRKLGYNKTLVKKNHECRCLVILHLYYDSSWKEINEYIKSLSPYRFDLIITTTIELIPQETIDQIKAEYPKAQVIPTENKGYDLQPFFMVLKTIDLEQYDIVFKLHSKSTKRPFVYIYRQFFLRRDWFLNLYEGILSGRNVHKTIETLFNRKGVGIIAAKNLIVKDPKHKVNLINKIAAKTGRKMIEDYSFVAGTCFAIKAECLKPLQEMHLENEEYPPLVASRGMSFAHFVERYICSVVVANGYTIEGNSANVFRRFLLKPVTCVMNRYSSERLYNEDVDFDDEWFFWRMDNALIKYKFDDIRFSDMKCHLINEIFPFVEGAPYKYIKEGDVAGYEEYCKLHEANNLPLMKKERYDCLIESIRKNGYDERKIIVVDQHNVLIDGQHRACILANMYGEDSYIRVLKIWDLKRLFRWIYVRN